MHSDFLTAVNDFREIDLDSGERHPRYLGRVDRGDHGGERRKHLGFSVVEICEFAGIEGT
ncbi:hypothetical protein Z045_25735 [Rhodococcus pyridinivorans KG-16]|uniref:Uncharacterized protein n=1 Tax=Rhodococcus pyridinivorans KG-16 TaxID=1441730 RepID=A0A0V9UD44_9NOCA|nr:hypothetical protein Z045_25735 [Rhodococcus pyridinivorans KG-16]